MLNRMKKMFGGAALPQQDGRLRLELAMGESLTLEVRLQRLSGGLWRATLLRGAFPKIHLRKDHPVDVLFANGHFLSGRLVCLDGPNQVRLETVVREAPAPSARLAAPVEVTLPMRLFLQGGRPEPMQPRTVMLSSRGFELTPWFEPSYARSYSVEMELPPDYLLVPLRAEARVLVYDRDLDRASWRLSGLSAADQEILTGFLLDQR